MDRTCGTFFVMQGKHADVSFCQTISKQHDGGVVRFFNPCFQNKDTVVTTQLSLHTEGPSVCARRYISVDWH